MAGGSAVKFVDSVEQALIRYRESPEGRKVFARQFGRHMIYGTLWIIGGAVFAIIVQLTGSAGGAYLVAFGTMIFGIVDFIRGLTGWLKYRN